MTKSALGRGFDSLIPTDFKVSDVASPGEQVRQLDSTKIVPNPDQPRKSFDTAALQELANSIKRHGVIQPIVVTPHKDTYRIVAGERRFRASVIAKLKTIPAIVRNHEELEELEIALVENVQRVDLSPLEQAVSIVRLRDQFSLSAKDIAAKLGKAETTISNIVRLLQLPKEGVEALQKNVISEGHARAILALKSDTKLQKELLNTIITQKLSVRDAEAFVKLHRDQKITPKKQVSVATQKLLSAVKKPLLDRLKVTEKSSTRGSITLLYTTPEELKDALQKLNS